ncbi:MAG: glycerol kinase [Bdellovibrio sp.]|nr:MAG: glycerol kinase [Bdellovibrio sp.]
MSIDQGTTGTTVLILDQTARVLGKATCDFEQIFPRPGWVEHRTEDIWKSVQSAIELALNQASIEPTRLAAIGITNQRETVAVWDRKTGQPLHHAIVWQCRRTTSFCEKLKKKNFSPLIRKKTGLVIDPYFSASKMNWLLAHVPGLKEKAKKGEALFGTIETYLIWRITGGLSHKTDISNASRTMLLDIRTGQWDDELLELFGVPRACLPAVEGNCADFGRTSGLGLLPDGIPIRGVAGDQQAALFGQACFYSGEAKCTFGTGSFLLLNTGAQLKYSKSGLVTTVAWQLPEQKIHYALEGSSFICGAAVQWLRDALGLIKTSDEIENLAAEVTDNGGVHFVPALTGMGAPYWWPEARGVICGLTRGSTKAHLARATLEAMALQNVDVLLAMERDLGKKLRSLKVDGGATVNNLLMQLQADLLGLAVDRPKNVETTSLGAAFLAGLGVGLWRDLDQLRHIWQLDRQFKVEIAGKERSRRLNDWHQAVNKVRDGS